MLQLSYIVLVFVVLGMWIFLGLLWVCFMSTILIRMDVSSADNSDDIEASKEAEIPIPAHPLPDMELIQLNQSSVAQEDLVYPYNCFEASTVPVLDPRASITPWMRMELKAWNQVAVNR